LAIRFRWTQPLERLFAWTGIENDPSGSTRNEQNQGQRQEQTQRPFSATIFILSRHIDEMQCRNGII
jgi:hypothetical protein